MHQSIGGRSVAAFRGLPLMALLVCMGVGQALVAPAPALASLAPNRTVTTLSDTNDGACTLSLCSLRDAVTYSSSTDVIAFASGLTGTIELSEELVVDHDLTIVGPGQSTLVISGK